MPRVGFLMEQALGHVTYSRNLSSAYAGGERLNPAWMPVPYACDGPLDKLPGVRRNWTARASLRAQAALNANGGARAFDALLYHTQTVALLSPLAARATAVCLSLDATPINFDSIGVHYQHRASPGSASERIKLALYRRVFQKASALTTWSQWAKDSLRDDYGVDPDLVTVIPPGVNLELFPFGRRRPASKSRRPRILFVGGDFARKGGPLLLACMRNGLSERCELDIVTSGRIAPEAGVHVYNDLGPNDPRLIELYRRADIFALPTHADCLAVVLGEAMASGLPVVTTAVGAQPEAVRDGESGLIVPAGDEPALGRALSRLLDAPALRRAMGRAGRATAEARFDASANAGRLVDVIYQGIDRRRRCNPRDYRRADAAGPSLVCSRAGAGEAPALPGKGFAERRHSHTSEVKG